MITLSSKLSPHSVLTESMGYSIVPPLLDKSLQSKNVLLLHRPSAKSIFFIQKLQLSMILRYGGSLVSI